MSNQHPIDDAGAAVWRASRFGPIAATIVARRARASDSEVTRANVRNAVNHAWTYALSAVLLVVVLLVVLPSVIGDRSFVTGVPVTLAGLLGLSVGSIAHCTRGIRAARHGEVFRTPGTVPFVR